MRQKCFTLLFLLTMALAAVAAETSATWCLIVESVGGEKIAIALKQKPVISTEAEGYKLTYGETTAEFAWSELKKLTLEETVPSASRTSRRRSSAWFPARLPSVALRPARWLRSTPPMAVRCSPPVSPTVARSVSPPLACPPASTSSKRPSQLLRLSRSSNLLHHNGDRTTDNSVTLSPFFDASCRSRSRSA